MTHAVDQRVGDIGVRGRTRVGDRAGDALSPASVAASASRPLTHDTGALFGEQFGDREPDAAGAADDDGAAAGQRR